MTNDPPKASGTIPPPNQIKPPAQSAPPPEPSVVVQPSVAAKPAEPESERRVTQAPPTRKAKASGDPRPWINPNARWQDFKPWRS